MELITDFKAKGYFTSSLYHLLAHKKMMPPETEIIPSTYLKEIKRSTEDRLHNLNGIEVNNLITSTDKNLKDVLQFTPKIIVFQNYKPNDKIVAKYTVRNISNQPTFLNMIFKASSIFSVKTCSGDLLSRLAPGIGVTFAVTFTPGRHEDYVHRITFTTDKQHYALALIAMGPRPIFEIPDEIVVPPTPLKVENNAVLHVKNVSCIVANYTIATKCPFAVKPKFSFNLHPGKSVTAAVTFRSMHCGKSEGKLLLTCETDEVFLIRVSGTTHTVSIELEKAVVRFLDTYNTMVRQQPLKITNKSDHILTYMCMKNDSIHKDFEEKIKLATIFYDVKDAEAAKYQKLVHYEVASSNEHERVYMRIFFDEIQSLVADESLHFNDMNFSITPIKGNLWPNETTTITINFSPKEIGDFVALAYLDIDGVLNRVPLAMKGTSLPPNIQLHVENLDMDNVYINKTYRYEIVAINKGHIDGVIQYREISSIFGSVISCTPETHCLSPGNKEVFVVSFLNSNQGPYFEELNFIIKDTNIVRKLYMKGTVIYPTMSFSVPCLDFGFVNIGVPKTLQVDVINESEVNVNGILKISSDGPEMSSITLEDCEACDDVALLVQPQWPKEFNIDPPKLTLNANARMTLRVTLTANLVRTNQTLLELELEKSDSPPITLPITFHAKVPTITPAPEIKLRACFLDYTYYYDAIISSDEYWGYFIIEEPEEKNTLQVDVAIKRGLIKPNSTISFPISIMTPVLGPQEYNIRMSLFACPNPINICRISVLGIRPIVTCNPLSLSWGHLNLLTRSDKILTLANDSPVTVNYKAGILFNDGKWSITPEEGFIDPEGETDLTLSLCLVDAKSYTNRAVIHLEKVKDIFVPLTVIGEGTSIVVGKDRDHVNLGRHFIKFPLEMIVPIENCGTHLHSLEWIENYKAPKLKELPPKFFNIEPKSIKIGAKEKLEIKISGLFSKVGFYKETWCLIGSIEGVNKKELLMECEIEGEFVEPKIILSTTQIDLRYDYGPYSEFYKLTDILTIKNVSKLPIHIDISIKPPFAIVYKETYKIDEEDADMCCCISYDKSDSNLQRILREAGLREPHKFLDCITKKPIKRQRQGPLHFFQDIRKIKLAYEFTYVVDERLEDEEIMKIQIVFDTTKHLNLKSKIYTDVMKVKLRGLKNKDAVRLTGKINFPNVTVYTPRVDFQCILNGGIESRTIKISNPTELMVCYTFEWKKWSAVKINVPELSESLTDYPEKLSEIKAFADVVPSSGTQGLVDRDIIQEKETLEGRDSLILQFSKKKSISVQDIEADFQVMKKKLLKKIVPMLHMDKDPEFKWARKFNKQIKEYDQDEINEVLQIIPHYGMLSPGDTHFIHVIFRPTMNISVRAILECQVLGGPSEIISVSGQSSDLIYKLNTHVLNFKIRSFHEPASEILIIKNMAQLIFEYKTYLDEPVTESSLPAKITGIDPPNKVVEAEEEIEIAVVVQPGVLGFFKKTFLLEIGYLPHIPIEIFGWGVIPQVYFSLPRPGLAKLNVEVGYKAIATITLDYLAAVSEILSNGITEHLNSPLTEKCFEDPYFEQEWHICSAWDGYPSLMDIEMAIERYLVVRHIKFHPDIMKNHPQRSTTSRILPIPGFNTTPYLLDFGVVITGNSVTYKIEVTNYGPIPVKLHLQKIATNLCIYVKLFGKLNPGEVGKLEVTFAPDSNVFPEYEQYIDMNIIFEVPYGVSIPVRVKALCAVPFLKSNINILNLGFVRCGDKIIASIPLANVGKPTCVWFVTLKVKSIASNALTITDNSGKYEPGESGWLSISFKPTMEMLYEGILVFRFHMNPTRMEIPVVGQGILPHPHIIGPNINFPPTLPWEQTTEIYFGITNPCPFPIELIIAHVDTKWKEEKEIFDILCKYYNKPEEILVPLVKPGASIPEPIEEFFSRFKTNVQRSIEENNTLAAKQMMNKGPVATKKNKSPKVAPKSGGKEKVDKEDKEKKIRTEAEIISDELMEMKKEGQDPLKECLLAMEDKPPGIDKYGKGLILFLHGSPYEEMSCKEMAYTLGKSLEIPTLNFDSCFIEALCVCRCVSKSVITNALNENWESSKKSTTTISDESVPKGNSDFNEYLDEFEMTMKKLELVATNKGSGTPRSKTSDKKKKDVSGGGSLLVMGNATTLFQMELIQELLTEYFAQDKFQCGFIIDSLTSVIIKIPNLVLTTVLKCKNTIFNIHLVLCQSDFNKWAQAYEDTIHEAELNEELLQQVKVYNDEEIIDIVKAFEEMDEEEYENADANLKAIYIKNGLEARRRKFFEKYGPTAEVTINKKEKGMRDHSGMIETDASDIKKKKREDTKSGKTAGKFGPEYANAQAKYNEYQKNVYDILIQIANNWIIEDCDLGSPLYTFNGAVMGATQKKKKEAQLPTADSVVIHEEPNSPASTRGFPLTIIMCPCLEYKEALVQMFKCPFIEKKLKPPDKVNILDIPVRRKEYTVLIPSIMPTLIEEEPLSWRFLDENPVKKCECNQITDLNLLDDTTQDNVLNILAKWHCICGKKVLSSQTSTTGLSLYEKNVYSIKEEEQPYFYPLPLHSVHSISEPSDRLILEPGDLVRCKYAFSPKIEGNFNIKRFVEVVGWPESRVDINISGICDLPRLDTRPKKMFASFVRRTLEDKVYKLTFLDDLKKFEFGPIFVGANRIYEEEYKIELKNASLLTADITLEFMDPDTIFCIDKSFISLQPGCRDRLTVSAAPSYVGDHNTYLMLCIKDNPEIVEIKISCSGVLSLVEILPLTKTIDYGKLLLYRREDDRFIVKNDSILPIMWKLRNPEDFVENFIVSRTNGIVPGYENQVVPVTYIACNVKVLKDLPMIIEIYDELGRGNPISVETLYLSGECYDVLVECAYENPNESFLNFGNVKVNSTVYRDMFLLNRGKYNIYYNTGSDAVMSTLRYRFASSLCCSPGSESECSSSGSSPTSAREGGQHLRILLKKVKNFPEPALLKTFDCFPDSGIIPPTMKLVVSEFSCSPATSMHLNNVPAYMCSLLDGSKDQVVVAKFPVNITIASFYNTFTLFPLGELNFHIIAVGSGVTRDLILNNTSKCPFIYEIVVPETYRVEPSAAQQAKGKETKLKNPPIKCGNFLINNEDNLLAPGESRTIKIQFLATAARTFEETISFIVSDTCPAEAQGVPLKLVGTGAMPILDFWNLENTFREHLIVKDLSEYKVPQSSPHCIFVENSVTLHFYCVAVDTSYTGAIDLYNNGVVPCILTIKLLYQPNTNEEIFSLPRYEIQIDALMHKRLEITFSPKALVEYRAVLEIKLKLLHDEEQTFQLCLIGEGVIPRIRLIKPPIRQHRLALLTFPVTCLGSTSHRRLTLQNITTINSTALIQLMPAPELQPSARPVFWMIPNEKCEVSNRAENETKELELFLKPGEVSSVKVVFGPLVKGKTNCDIKIKILLNPYEYFTVMCEAEAFVEDVILTGLEMLSMDYDLDAIKGDFGASSANSNEGVRKKVKSAPPEKQKSKDKSKYSTGPNGEILEPGVLKYSLDFGGCELCSAQKRSVIMLNNSEKLYKFLWEQLDNILVKPAVGYLSPGEEKDIEITFYSALPVVIKRELLSCNLVAISDDFLGIDSKGSTWDSRQTQTYFDVNAETCQEERVDARIVDPGSRELDILRFLNIIIIYSVHLYKKYVSSYQCSRTSLPYIRKLIPLYFDFITQQHRNFKFEVRNISNVPMKIAWNFFIEDEYPARIHKIKRGESENASDQVGKNSEQGNKNSVDDKGRDSKETLFSGSMDRYSVDTCLDVDIPFKIEPMLACIHPQGKQEFNVIFSPMDAFEFTVQLRSSIDNLDPYDQDLACKITARSLIPYVHLDLEESDYLWSGRRVNVSGIVLPPHMQVLEFNVLGSGCYKKTFQVINPTSDAYEFVFMCVLDDPDSFVPMHCNKLKGYLEGGTSTDVTFTFSPTGPGVYESQWRFRIDDYSISIPLMIVGTVRQPDVLFVPTILIMKSCLVGFTMLKVVKLKNNEDEALKYEFKGDSLIKDHGKTLIIVEPNSGTLKPNSETSVTICYTPVQDGPISFKIFCQITYMINYLSLCVNALSYQIKPTVTYYIIGNEHVLDYDVVTNIHLEQTASTYERNITFKIKNDGSATFNFEWNYAVASVKKYLTVSVEPRTGYIPPAAEVECILHFKLRAIPVQAYPVTLRISDGPLYQIYLHAEIEQPSYHFSFREYDFGKCLLNAPHKTYKKNLAFTNDHTEPLTLDLVTESTAELYLDYRVEPMVQPKQRVKIPLYFRPNAVKHYEFQLHFWVHSLCEEVIMVRGEGVPLLVDLYKGCQKPLDLGPVRVGEKIVHEIEVINYSKVPIDCTFVLKEVYPNIEDDVDKEEEQKSNKKNAEIESLGSSICLDPSAPGIQGVHHAGPSRTKFVKLYRDEARKKQIEEDSINALASVKVIPEKAIINPHQKVPLKIHFKPVGLINALSIQLNLLVLDMVRPILQLSGSATGMKLYFSQNSLQFGRVRKRGCKILKVMLYNKGDFGTKFWWQPLAIEDFSISPMHGTIAAKTNVTFTVTCRPREHNAFLKAWACCNIVNYKCLELVLHAACVEFGTPQHQSLYIECPVREIKTDYVVITNPTDGTWLVLSEFSEETSSFETLREFQIEANAVFEIPIHFKPKTVGQHDAQVLFSPLGESALFVTLIGVALHPNPNGVIDLTVEAKKPVSEPLTVYNISEVPEMYVVTTELIKVIPEKFNEYYEIKYPDTVKVWGEAKGTCLWTFVCFEPCEMNLKVMLVNSETKEYQYYLINVKVLESKVMGTLRFSCRARESVEQDVLVSNPLEEDAEFSIVCQKLQCAESCAVAANSQSKLTMTYSPLVVGEFEDTLTITNHLIGTYAYRVIAICKPAKEKYLEYSTTFGTMIPIRLRLQNKSNANATFIATTSHPSIILERNYELPAFEKGKFLLWFEPTELGVQDSRVSFNSDIAGEFVFNIKGIGSEIKPQGPFRIKAGGFASIKFKNVFEETRTFRISVDREEFYVKTQMEQLKPKKETKVMVYLNEKATLSWNSSDAPTGSLSIETFEPVEPKVQWTYFLQAIP